MDDAEFFKTLAGYDPGVADRWKRVAKTLGKTLDVKELDAIVGPIFDAGAITAKQAKAVWFFRIYTWEKYTPRALGALVAWIEEAYLLDVFFKGSAVQLASEASLKEFHAAVGATASVINFTSPGTGLVYSADHYSTIRRLVVDGKIEVYEVDAATLAGKKGTYASNSDRLVIYKGFPPTASRAIIVHEVTHAIQDWNDVVKMNKYTEADGFVAGAVAALSVDPSAFEMNFAEEKLAAEFVLKKTAVPGNKAWEKTYEDLASAIARPPSTYAGVAHQHFETRKDRIPDEKKIFGEILQQIKAGASPTTGMPSSATARGGNGTFPQPLEP